MLRRFLHIALLLLLTSATQLRAQNPIPTTDSLLISGEVEAPIVLHLQDIAAMPSVKLKDISITNHKGESKGKLQGLRGVPLKTALAGVTYRSESPKRLSELYFVCQAADGYTVVFSWNEIYNHPSGDRIYLLTEMAGQNLQAMPQRIALVAPTDTQTGRRYVKGLAKITVCRAR